jgi:hypothetical protein
VVAAQAQVSVQVAEDVVPLNVQQYIATNDALVGEAELNVPADRVDEVLRQGWDIVSSTHVGDGMVHLVIECRFF